MNGKREKKKSLIQISEPEREVVWELQWGGSDALGITPPPSESGDAESQDMIFHLGKQKQNRKSKQLEVGKCFPSSKEAV